MRFNFKSRRARLVAEIVVVVLILFAVRAYSQRGTAHGMAPPFEGELLDGHHFNLSNLRGRPVLVQFWATWCPICRLELNSIAAIAKDHAVITVAQQSGQADAVRAYLERQGVSFPVIVDPDGVLAQRYGVRAVPASFVIGPHGHIRFVEVGYTTEWGLRARLWWAR